ncbi:MAG TPA: L-threonylcarbamoyladenylate synthase [Anaerolineae bacterium]|nr:L-threonylcarbamoyladenylate synthase [Anaerolineae bacterium]
MRKTRYKTQVLPAGAPGALDLAVELLLSGEPVVFPTDTVYGLGADALIPAAVERLYAVKQRPLQIAVPLLLADACSLSEVCVDVPPLAWKLAGRFWPGALSLVLRRAPAVPDVVTAGGWTVAVRVPDHGLVRELCRRLDAPLAVTSANRHRRPDPVTAAAALHDLNGRVPLLLDGGTCPGGVPSTVLDMTASPPTVRRTGPITEEQIAAALGPGSWISSP